MQIKVFFATMSNYDEAVDEMNTFMRSHKVSGPPREEFYVGDGGPIWCFLLRYTEGATPSSSQQSAGWNREKKDWSKELTHGQYEMFEALKPLRRKVADEAGSGNQVYKVLTDAELAEICKLKKFTVEEALKINGIGQSKKEYIESLLKQYGEGLLEAGREAGDDKDTDKKSRREKTVEIFNKHLEEVSEAVKKQKEEEKLKLKQQSELPLT